MHKVIDKGFRSCRFVSTIVKHPVQAKWGLSFCVYLVTGRFSPFYPCQSYHCCRPVSHPFIPQQGSQTCLKLRATSCVPINGKSY